MVTGKYMYIQVHVYNYVYNVTGEVQVHDIMHTHVYVCTMQDNFTTVVYNNNTSNSSQLTGRCWWVEHTGKHVQLVSMGSSKQPMGFVLSNGESKICHFAISFKFFCTFAEGNKCIYMYIQ